MTHQFHELLLSELRMVVYQPGNPAEVTDRMVCEAVTLNENIRSLGYVLRPDDVLRMAASPSMHGFFDHLKALTPDVKDKPMYPGFPQQVMEMSEAEFRLHQAIHYFTTYGLEMLLGQKVKRGWLPEYPADERTQRDTRLMESRVIELIAGQEAPAAVLRTLMGRRERMTNPELDLALECVPLCSAEQLQGIKVRFKENLDLLFPRLMACTDREAALRTLRAVCAHAGDVLACSKEYLRRRKYHLTTAEKKLLVKLLETYPVGNLRENLMQSQRLRERNLQVLQHLDYNRFSRSAAHREAVRALRNGELLSWRGVGEALLGEHSPQALKHFAQRPGYMVRMINRLLSLEYGAEEIAQALLPHAGKVSGHLAVKTLRAMLKRSDELEARYKEAVKDCMRQYDAEMRPPSEENYWEESGIRSRAQWRRTEARQSCLIGPENALREEVFAKANALEMRLIAAKARLSAMKEAADYPERTNMRSMKTRWYRNAEQNMDMHALNRKMEEYLGVSDWEMRKAREKVSRLNRLVEEARKQAQPEFACRAAVIRAEGERRLAPMLEEIDAWEQAQIEQLQKRIEAENAQYVKQKREAVERRDAKLKQLEDAYQHELRAAQFDAQTAEILRRLLEAHFRQADTPLKGKKVFVDMDAFDLGHSVMETEDRSRDGGYIRSGIAYRIPENARYVRFFVYWNDKERIDIDLHAGGTTMDGRHLHVGWNSDFRRDGVVHSGDITHSDAAEYIDIDLSAPIREIYANVNLFSGQSFRDVETCYVGMMAVDQNGQTIERYDPANCFFTHRLTQKTRNLYYGFIDVQNRFVRFVGQENRSVWEARPSIESEQNIFSLEAYLNCVMEGQGVQRVDNPAEADVVLTMGKSLLANGLSLVDSNFFLEC